MVFIYSLVISRGQLSQHIIKRGTAIISNFQSIILIYFNSSQSFLEQSIHINKQHTKRLSMWNLAKTYILKYLFSCQVFKYVINSLCNWIVYSTSIFVMILVFNEAVMTTMFSHVKNP